MGDSLTAAAQVLRSIPVVGGLLSDVFGAIASATESVAASMKGAAAGGASFGGSMHQLQMSAGQAGMTMEKFGALVANNGEGMLGFGSTTESGAKNFARLSGQLRAAGGELYALGMGTEEINQGFANYGKLLRSQGMHGNKSSTELIEGSKKYLKEIDQLAKITGESRKAKEDERAQLAIDNQLSAALSDANEDVAASAHFMIQSMPGKAMKDFAKDMIANGTATTDANRLLMSQYPGMAAELTKMYQTTQANTVIQKSAMKNTAAIGVQESKNFSHIKTAAAAMSDTLGPTTEAMNSMRKVNLAAYDEATEQQKAAKAHTDNVLKTTEAMKSQLAVFSDNIKLQLMNSGSLGLMMSIIQKLVDFVIAVVIPGIGMLIPILGKIFDGAIMLIKPIVESLTKAFGGMGGALSAVDNILNWLFSTLNGVVRGGILIFESILRGIETLSGPFKRLGDVIFGVEKNTGDFGDTLILIGDAVGTALEILAQVIGFVIDYAILPLIGMFKNYFMPTIEAVGGFIMDYLVPILVAAGIAFIAFNLLTILGSIAKFAYIAAMVVATVGLGLLAAGLAIVVGAVAFLTSWFGLAVVGIAALIYIFKKAGGDFQVVTDGLKYLWEGLKTFFSALKLGFFQVLDALPGVDFTKEIEEEEKKIVEQKAERERLATAMSKRMDENKAKAAADATKKDDKNEGGLLDKLKGLFNIDHKNRAGAHIAQKNAQVNSFNSIPGAVGGGMASGMPGLTEGVKEGIKEAAKVDTNAGPEALLKQFSARESGGVEKNVKRDELLLAKDVAFKDYTIATSKEQKAVAEAKIQDANAKLKALDEPASQPVAPTVPQAKPVTAPGPVAPTVPQAKPVTAPGPVAPAAPNTETAKTSQPVAPVKPRPTNSVMAQQVWDSKYASGWNPDGSAKTETAKTSQPVNPAAPKSQAALGPAAKDQTLKDLEKQQQDKTAAEKKKAEEDAAKKKQEEDAVKKKQEEDKNKKPESAETLLAELNTKMATLLKYTFTVAHNTNETVSATRSLNGNLLKS
jgi:hypothetical protein